MLYGLHISRNSTDEPAQDVHDDLSDSEDDLLAPSEDEEDLIDSPVVRSKQVMNDTKLTGKSPSKWSNTGERQDPSQAMRSSTPMVTSEREAGTAVKNPVVFTTNSQQDTDLATEVFPGEIPDSDDELEDVDAQQEVGGKTSKGGKQEVQSGDDATMLKDYMVSIP